MAPKKEIVFWGWVFTCESDGSGAHFRKAGIRTDGNHILEISKVKPAEYDYAGVVIPPLEDAHTHLADRQLEVPDGTSLSDVVQPPDGLKHKYLERAPPEEITSSITQGLEGLVRAGCTSVHDFREGGIKGANLFWKAEEALPSNLRPYLQATVLGRPGPKTKIPPQNERAFRDGMKKLLAICDGVGLSSITDGNMEWNTETARIARRAGKLVELHCSEARHEPLDTVLEAGPNLLVHMIHGTPDDFERLANHEIPVVICTRSNEFFSTAAPVHKMLEAGVSLRLGSDNAFLGPADMWQEMRAFSRVHKLRAGLTPIQILMFALRKKGINETAPIAPRDGDPASFLIVNLQTERPDRDLVGKANGQDVVAIVGPQRGKSP